eukprot:TRINITY_DN12166_c0_g1_i3.p1 TRINITY_DN12166_c0_g1~~TRINITY_DN12166_c0_g1_i3.p1  ORF type:complete len:229 (-),score=48.05 TRINITY_DN12166_c0_g1_i3:181-867(-)
MGLDYLKKKRWHPGSLRNIKEVCLAEQAERDRLRQQRERQKRLEEERQDEELKRAQVKAGLIPEHYLARMDWMYAQPATKETPVERVLGSSAKQEECEGVVRFQGDPLAQAARREVSLIGEGAEFAGERRVGRRGRPKSRSRSRHREDRHRLREKKRSKHCKEKRHRHKDREKSRKKERKHREYSTKDKVQLVDNKKLKTKDKADSRHMRKNSHTERDATTKSRPSKA